MVDAADATILAANWHSSTSSGATVPEPQTLVLLLSAAMMLFVQRK